MTHNVRLYIILACWFIVYVVMSFPAWKGAL